MSTSEYFLTEQGTPVAEVKTPTQSQTSMLLHEKQYRVARIVVAFIIVIFLILVAILVTQIYTTVQGEQSLTSHYNLTRTWGPGVRILQNQGWIVQLGFDGVLYISNIASTTESYTLSGSTPWIYVKFDSGSGLLQGIDNSNQQTAVQVPTDSGTSPFTLTLTPDGSFGVVCPGSTGGPTWFWRVTPPSSNVSASSGAGTSTSSSGSDSTSNAAA